MDNEEYVLLKSPSPEIQIIEKEEKPDTSKNLNSFIIIHTTIIILSSTISYMFNLRQYELPKNSFLTGIPFLRTNYFIVNIIVFTMLYLFSIILFFFILSDSEKQKFKQSFFVFNKKLMYFYIFHNLIIYVLFNGIYNLIYQPLYEDTKFRLSGHVLITLFSSNIMINFIDVIDLFKYYKINHFNLIVLRVSIYIILLHNLYVVIWTCGYYHTIWESILSLIIGSLFLLSLNYYSLEIRHRK